jgi:outer membrane protein OmpA-like peptidoglycan-associated protein
MGALVNDKSVYKQINAGATAFQEDMEALKHNFLLRGFFNKRGYEDSDELTKHKIAHLPSAPVLKVLSYDPKQIFDKPDTAKLKNKKILNDAGNYLESNAFGEAVVEVSAGPTGESDKDKVLTEARATVVREYLANNFRFDDTRLKTMPIGKSEEGAQLKIIVFAPEVSDRPVSKR